MRISKGITTIPFHSRDITQRHKQQTKCRNNKILVVVYIRFCFTCNVCVPKSKFNFCYYNILFGLANRKCPFFSQIYVELWRHVRDIYWPLKCFITNNRSFIWFVTLLRRSYNLTCYFINLIYFQYLKCNV